MLRTRSPLSRSNSKLLERYRSTCMSEPRRQRSFWARIKLSEKKRVQKSVDSWTTLTNKLLFIRYLNNWLRLQSIVQNKFQRTSNSIWERVHSLQNQIRSSSSIFKKLNLLIEAYASMTWKERESRKLFKADLKSSLFFKSFRFRIFRIKAGC